MNWEQLQFWAITTSFGIVLTLLRYIWVEWSNRTDKKEIEQSLFNSKILNKLDEMHKDHQDSVLYINEHRLKIGDIEKINDDHEIRIRKLEKQQ